MTVEAPDRIADDQCVIDWVAKRLSAKNHYPNQVMPPLSGDEFRELEASIKTHGVQVPIVVDENSTIIDGHHRALISELLGKDCPISVKKSLRAGEKRELAYTLNVNRRHLNREQKRQLVIQSLRSDPKLSDRQHARRTGVTHPTVADVRNELEREGGVEKFSTRTDSTGREQPASKPPAGAIIGADCAVFDADVADAELAAKLGVDPRFARDPAQRNGFRRKQPSRTLAEQQRDLIHNILDGLAKPKQTASHILLTRLADDGYEDVVITADQALRMKNALEAQLAPIVRVYKLLAERAGDGQVLL